MNVNFPGEAIEAFRNEQVFNGLDVWSKLLHKISDENPARNNEILTLISNPPKTNKFEELHRVFESWETNLRLYPEWGGARSFPMS